MLELVTTSDRRMRAEFAHLESEPHLIGFMSEAPQQVQEFPRTDVQRAERAAKRRRPYPRYATPKHRRRCRGALRPAHRSDNGQRDKYGKDLFLPQARVRQHPSGETRRKNSSSCRKRAESVPRRKGKIRRSLDEQRHPREIETGSGRNNPFCMRLFPLDVLSIPPTAKQKLKDFIHLAKLMKCVWVCEYKRAAPLGVCARHFNKSSSTLYILFQPDVTDIKHLRLQQAKL